MQRITRIVVITLALLASACSTSETTAPDLPAEATMVPTGAMSTAAGASPSTVVAPKQEAQPQVVVYPNPGDLTEAKGLSQSKVFTVTVNRTPAFVYEASGGWSFFNFAFADTEAQVVVTVNEQIDTWQVRPVSAEISAVQTGNVFTFAFAQPMKLVLQINGPNSEKLLISAEAPETQIPDPKDPSVLYYGPGVHYMGYKYDPPLSIHTVYLAGGAVVRGTLFSGARSGLSILGRGIFAMGEWPHDPQQGLSLIGTSGLVIDGITVVDSPGWQLTIPGSNGAIIHNVKLLATKDHYNTDGVSMCCTRSVKISDFFILANDDSFPVDGSTRRLEVRDGLLWNSTNGHSFMLAGRQTGTYDVLFENIDVLENGGSNAGVFGSSWGGARPYPVSGVTFRNIRIENATSADGSRIPMFDMKIGPESMYNDGSLGRIQDIRFENVSFPFGGGWIKGLDTKNGFSNIIFVNCTVGGKPLNDISQLGLQTAFVTDLRAQYDLPLEATSAAPEATSAATRAP